MSRLPLVALACFAVGAVTMLLFEYTLTRVVGVVALFAAIVAGVFAIAGPELLAGEDDGEPDG